ncbi:MAG: response regulator transcription factor [Actinomycetota bacterium]|nr:response regulator transcription factor [Actinomycetota bacterium]
MADSRRILVVDDEPVIVDLVRTALEDPETLIRSCGTGQSAIDVATTMIPDLIILDVMLPDMDGFEVLERIKANWRTTSVPVLYLSARREVDDRIYGLRLGGTDYVVKPFEVEELRARVNTILSRTMRVAAPAESLKVGDLVVDLTRQEVSRGGVSIDLTPAEYRLLTYLMINANQVVTRAQIRDTLWDDEVEDAANQIAVYISYLRRKIDATGTAMIRTIRGVGYSIRAPH